MDLLQLDQQGLLLIGRLVQQLLNLLLQQFQRAEVVPQAVFQQQQIDWGHGVATTEESTGLQQPQRFFPATIGNVRGTFQCIQPLAQLEYQFKAILRQFDFVDLRLPLVIFLVTDAQCFGHRVFILVLAADQQ
ncbi:hypothetical protein D3C80_1247890 [compost metagenome]